jgi:ABC-type polysaccharide/polyol phosphate transport system ATPase subunit
MNGEPVIEFESVWKSFRRHTEQALLRSHVASFVFHRKRNDLFHALQDITFRVHSGEGVAIIGANGAGKSTLLSMIAGLVPQDRGKVTIQARVVPLLELGSGFHIDLTGAENVRLYASLLGISREELREAVPRITEFADIGDYIDEPLRTYSTGMIMRLAFSVATSLDPEVLLIDEVLAVGDQAFQAKCFERIEDFRRRGKTIICVSHSAGMVQRLCTRGIWLDHGSLMLDGPLDKVVAAYQGRSLPISGGPKR